MGLNLHDDAFPGATSPHCEELCQYFGITLHSAGMGLRGTPGVVVGEGRHIADAGALRPGLSAEHAHDLLWMLTSADVHRLLVTERGWSLDDYEHWLATTLQDALIGPPPR